MFPTNMAMKAKRIVFEDNDEQIEEDKSLTEKRKKKKKDSAHSGHDMKANKAPHSDDPKHEEEDYFAKREKQAINQKGIEDNGAKDNKRWYNMFAEYPSNQEILEMKESEQLELYNICRTAYEAEKFHFNKQNPADARWLQTALQKGTAKDRANAGALLVTSNPLANLETLATLIGFTKLSNKTSAEVIATVTDVWKEVLLPPHRKLYSLQMRGADWKLLSKKTTSLTKEQQRLIFAYWYFENELKDQYFEFLKNLQQGIQTGQENNKTVCIVAASKLLSFAPEKEQMLLTMLINKLGDPVARVASKALHHLTDVASKHPNMCGVFVAEAEKLLFRNNISDRAQHLALCYLANIAPACRSDVCTKLVNICFALFKVLVQKGAVNNRTMQAILRCLQRALLEAKPAEDGAELLSKDMQDTVYRLVHLADIRISVQTMGLLLQLITVKPEKSDRFYNALYIKLLDMNLTSVGTKTAAHMFHIVHRAIHIDGNIARARAFVKRLLQLALYMPSNMAAGCLIVVYKLMQSRKELVVDQLQAQPDSQRKNAMAPPTVLAKVLPEDEELAKFGSDGEERYEDIVDKEDDSLPATTPDDKDEKSRENQGMTSSWHHIEVVPVVNEGKVRDLVAYKYDPFHRVPAFAGAEFALCNELLLLREHFHPTVQVFADNILNQKRIDYYGDPLRDFGLAHFLERFSFKNPKKLNNEKAEASVVAHKRYVAQGARGKPVKSLTKETCTEDEMFIFNFLEEKRKHAFVQKVEKANKANKADTEAEAEAEAETGLQVDEVNDDEFEEYLDSFFSRKKKKVVANAEETEGEELDFLSELGGEMETNLKRKRSKKGGETFDDDGVEDVDADWGDEGDDANISDDAASTDLEEDNNDSDDDNGSLDANSTSDDDDDKEDDDLNDDMATRPSKKSRKALSAAIDEGNFAKKLKRSNDMSSLFAAADDFAELLEETGKTKLQGTTNAIFNKDKSSDKQLKWEEKRRSNTKVYKSRKNRKSAKSGRR